MSLPSQVVEAVVAHSRFCAPEEACGLLAIDREGKVAMVYCLTNVDRSSTSFTVDPTEHFHALRHAERSGWTIGGAFHSHPSSPPVPSRTDVAAALDPTWLYVIVSLATRQPEVRSYHIADGIVSEVVGAVASPSEVAS